MEYLHGILDDDSCDDKHAHAVASPSSQPSLASTSAYGPTQYPQSVSRQLLGLSDLLLPLLVRQVVSNKNHCSQKDQMSLRVRLSFVVLSPVGRPSRPVRIFALPCLLLCDLCPLSLCDAFPIWQLQVACLQQDSYALWRHQAGVGVKVCLAMSCISIRNLP
ncbi:hypothetical protein MLD38_036644 [Melastoma candidum]|uniref:Uncharacterized protein n=1 Tax=Melastoma candidum TaxID=119954 RepID=A0ACB9LK72_9MYRT|nr:hypothetical protein MLD38_036644 [Melastoma candidum]